MFFFSHHPRFLRLVSLVVLAGYLLSVWGALPSSGMLVNWVKSGTSQAYPCAGSGCACSHATECWTSCSCHTEVESLVWALRNGVEPPRQVRFADEYWESAIRTLTGVREVGPEDIKGAQGKLRRGIALRAMLADEEYCGVPSPDAVAQADEPAPTEPADQPEGPVLSAIGCTDLPLLVLVGVGVSLPRFHEEYSHPRLPVGIAFEAMTDAAGLNRSRPPSPPPRA
ncbi:MAG: hypothetical protein ACF8MJ_03670 [Phycisphaerales bacterium JB050]